MNETISKKRKIKCTVLNGLIWAAAGIICLFLVGMIVFILQRGLKHISVQLLISKPSLINETVGILPNILNTLYIILMTMIVVLPLGVGSAIYLNEYAKNKKAVKIIELAAETLAGIPSIIYGLVGMLIFVQFCSLGTSLLAGALTLVIMTLPTIIRTTQESLKTVPDSYREGSLGLGAGKGYMIRTEEAISYAVKFLTDNNLEMKENAFEAEKQIDRKEREIESLCMKLLMHQQPVATDFRMITSALKMISDMERIGDQAEDIAEIAGYVNNADLLSKVNITEMAEAAVQMVMNSIDSFVKKDSEIAYSVIALDDKMDNLFLQVKKQLIEAVQNGHRNAEALIDLLMIAKYFERIGDHAENIAEWVIYAITGVHKG